jgi:hypothetical protein
VVANKKTQVKPSSNYSRCFLVLLAAIPIWGCETDEQLNVVSLESDLPSLSIGGERNIPSLDTLVLKRHYNAACHLEVDSLRVPQLQGVLNADRWNRLFVEFSERVIAEYCASNSFAFFEAEPDLSNDISDTLDFVRFDFEILTWNDSVASIVSYAVFEPSGGNAWWAEDHIFNIALQTGLEIPIPDDLTESNLAELDVFICDFFEASGGCWGSYVCHSCFYPDHVKQAIASHSVGISNGHWIAREMMYPGPCSHAAKSYVPVPLRGFTEAVG